MYKRQALDLAIQSVQGCVALMRHEGTHPKELVDQVCSPAGTTIEGVMKVRELGFENTVYKGIEAIMDLSLIHILLRGAGTETV